MARRIVKWVTTILPDASPGGWVGVLLLQEFDSGLLLEDGFQFLELQ